MRADGIRGAETQVSFYVDWVHISPSVCTTIVRSVVTAKLISPSRSSVAQKGRFPQPTFFPDVDLICICLKQASKTANECNKTKHDKVEVTFLKISI